MVRKTLEKRQSRVVNTTRYRSLIKSGENISPVHNHLYSGYRSLSSTLSKEEYELHYLTPELIYVVLGMSKRKAIKFVHKHNSNKQKQILSKK